MNNFNLIKYFLFKKDNLFLVLINFLNYFPINNNLLKDHLLILLY